MYKNIIVTDEEGTHYYDNHGVELEDGDVVSINGAEPEKIYLTDEGTLGTDATNPAWLKSGRATACEYGSYPLNRQDMENILVVKKAGE